MSEPIKVAGEAYYGFGVDIRSLDSTTTQIIEELGRFARSVKGVSAAVLFGNSARGDCRSDIDFKLILDYRPTAADRRETAAFAERIHLHFDRPGQIGPSDVPFGRKTVVGPEVLEGALALDAFKSNRGMDIPPIHFTKLFLESDTCQMRTTLSALTTPHILVAGDVGSHSAVCDRAFAAVLNLLETCYGVARNDWGAVLVRLIEAPDGRTFKEYLGYLSDPVIIAWLNEQWRRSRALRDG